MPLDALQQAHLAYPQFSHLAQHLQQHWLNPIQGCYRFHFDETTLDLWLVMWLKICHIWANYMNSKIDAWFLDGFAPSKNPDMWNEQLYQQMFRFTKPQGTFATFTAASAVRKGLENAGFDITKRKGFGKKTGMSFWSKNAGKTNRTFCALVS